MDIVLIVAVLAALVGLDVAALRWGRDSRRGRAAGRFDRRDWW